MMRAAHALCGALLLTLACDEPGDPAPLDARVMDEGALDAADLALDAADLDACGARCDAASSTLIVERLGMTTSEAGDQITLRLTIDPPEDLRVSLYCSRPRDVELAVDEVQLTASRPTAEVRLTGLDNSALDGDRRVEIDLRAGPHQARVTFTHRDNDARLAARLAEPPWIVQLTEGRGAWRLAPDDTGDGAWWTIVSSEAGYAYVDLQTRARIPLTGPDAEDGRRQGAWLVYREGASLYRVHVERLERVPLGEAARLLATSPGGLLVLREGAPWLLTQAGARPLNEAPVDVEGCAAGAGRFACWGAAGLYLGDFEGEWRGPIEVEGPLSRPAVDEAGIWVIDAAGRLHELEGGEITGGLEPQVWLSPTTRAGHLLALGSSGLTRLTAGGVLEPLIERPHPLIAPERGERCACCGEGVCGAEGCGDAEPCEGDDACAAPRRCLGGACRAPLEGRDLDPPRLVGGGLLWSAFGDLDALGCERHLFWSPLRPTARAALGLGAPAAQRAAVTPEGAWWLEGAPDQRFEGAPSAWATQILDGATAERVGLTPTEAGWRVAVDRGADGWGGVDLTLDVESERRPILGDLEGDGVSQLLIHTGAGWARRALEEGAEPAPVEGAPEALSALGDVDGDGRDDPIVIAREGGSWRWSWGRLEDGAYTPRGAWIGGALEARPSIADVDGDGRVDACLAWPDPEGWGWSVAYTRDGALGAGPWVTLSTPFGAPRDQPLWRIPPALEVKAR